jgi:hypothetical protein
MNTEHQSAAKNGRGTGLLNPWLMCACLLAGPVLAWHPHPDITRAALEVLGPDEALVRQLGPAVASLRDNSLMPDWRRSLRRDKAAWFYTDDFLLLPGMSKHLGHMCPEVKETYEPFFRRALQALRTESAVNACRWTGSLVHFVEDTGAPPHAAIVGGDLHGKTENFASPEKLHLAGYHPHLLGRTDDEALAGLRQRMEGLIEFSKPRFERAKPFAVSGDRAKADPILIESAEECARVVADLLLTLGKLAAKIPGDQNASLNGQVVSLAAPGLELLPAKLLLLGTKYSTLADAMGRYEFKHLPSGNYVLAVLRPGSAVATEAVTLASGRESVKNITLTRDTVAGNLVRNPACSLHWLAPDRADAWYPATTRSKPPKKTWEGDLLPLRAGAQYRLQVEWQDKTTGKVGVRLLASGPNKPVTDLTPITPGETQLDFAATAGTVHAQIVILSDDPPEKVCRHIALVPTNE